MKQWRPVTAWSLGLRQLLSIREVIGETDLVAEIMWGGKLRY